MERRRLGRDDLKKSSPFFSEEGLSYRSLFREERLKSGTLSWRVYKSYETKTHKVETHDPRHPVIYSYYLIASEREGRGAARIAKTYDPFVDTPYLFLEFARLRPLPDSETAVLQWVSKYGLLGITRRKEGPLPSGVFPEEGYTGIVLPPPWRYDDRGGPAELFNYFVWSVEDAREVLTMYEAVLNEDVEELEWQLFENDYFTSEVRERALRRAFRTKDSTGATREEVVIDVAMRHICGTVARQLELFAYPTFINRSESPLAHPKHLEASYGARNLLGAMYLQFYWLLTSQGSLSRCKHCGRIISHAPPPISAGGKARKPRKDKEFCNSRCRQNYHYQNRVKPNRNAERNGGTD